MKVTKGVWVSYHDMYGQVDFVDEGYFVIKVKEAYDNRGAVRICVHWDSQYTVHESSPAPPE